MSEGVLVTSERQQLVESIESVDASVSGAVTNDVTACPQGRTEVPPTPGEENVAGAQISALSSRDRRGGQNHRRPAGEGLAQDTVPVEHRTRPSHAADGDINSREILRDGLLGKAKKAAQRACTRSSPRTAAARHDREILLYAKGSSEDVAVTRTSFRLQAVVEQVTSLNESLVAKKQLMLECYGPCRPS